MLPTRTVLSLVFQRQCVAALGMWQMRMSTEAGKKPPSARVEQIRAIRDATSAPLLDCKKALDEAGSVEGALKLLKAKGIKTVAREGRIAGDGALALSVKEGSGSLIELNSETDFVSRLPEFQALAQSIADRTLAQPGNGSTGAELVERLLESPLSAAESAGGSVKDAIAQFMYKTGEKIELKRALRLQEFSEQSTSSRVVVGGYVHPGAKHASLVALRAKGQDLAGKLQPLEELSRNLAIQVTGFKPKYLSRGQAPADLAQEPGETTPFLLEQIFFMADPSGGTTVSQSLARLGSQLGASLSVEVFHQWSLGQTMPNSR